MVHINNCMRWYGMHWQWQWYALYGMHFLVISLYGMHCKWYGMHWQWKWKWYALSLAMKIEMAWYALSITIVCIDNGNCMHWQWLWYALHFHCLVWYALAMVWNGMVCIANSMHWKWKWYGMVPHALALAMIMEMVWYALEMV
jgi:hypothetical protein